jgi:hypothetical protein
MWFLLAIVASSAAVLSFSALKDLADLCGFHHALSPLLPGVVDAGAAAGCLVWLSPKDVTTEARRFARALTWVLLASSVAGNAIVHGLSAYGLQPHWTLVVAVSGVAPAVLGAVVHLSVLLGRGATEAINESTLLESRTSEPDRNDADDKPPDFIPAGIPPASSSPKLRSETPPAPSKPKRTRVAATSDSSPTKKPGRRALARSLGISEYEARRLLEQRAAEKVPNNGHRVLEDA